MKNSAMRDKSSYTDKLAEKAQIATKITDMKTVFLIPEKLCGNNDPKQDLPVKAEVGSAITDLEERAKPGRCRKHSEPIRSTDTSRH